ncbi:MAG: S8 family serine peptidase [Ignavibacteria bacterium]|jgi:subtilisin family serine protease|nr:S8 family serine peptidase [Ignavibacteria bacterium]MCU7501966.1 S8 family serine peptidase [Ignavibacteria bacterium]MCU7516934.1 S8 family serine peptidase [Ignavibacteria bacterium]
MKLRNLLPALLLFVHPLNAQDTSQTFLSLKPTGVENFLSLHPDYDGRGTVIFVLDTGVDMGIDGLKTTPDGKPKVIDVRDFTGQGNVRISGARLEKEDGEFVLENAERTLSVKGVDKLGLKPVDGSYFIGNFDEERFKNSNSGVKDLNGNGKTNDNFVVVVFKTSQGGEEFWVAYFDTNADGSLEDEKPLRSYHEKFDTFQIQQAPGRLPYFTFAFNIFPEAGTVSVFYDDGAHGTHVSGIASGYMIGREKHFNGVAPGSKLVGLKIGQNTMSGGATVTESMKRAYLFADSVSRVWKQPCIINMSFGIGSVIEGNADMELFLQDLLRKNPYLYVCTSNGNNGPGISSSGLPASSKYVLSSGAVLTKDVGRDVYSASLSEDIILHFSARGGEVSKPDVVSPGACVSTVPNWSTSDRMWGTSMASPYSTGVTSLILSAVSQKYPGLKIPSQVLFRAIKNGAMHMDGYTALDEGAGYINVEGAFSVLEKMIKNKDYEDTEDYNITAYVPSMANDRAPNLYFRDGSIIKDGDTFRYNISRVNAGEGKKFYGIFNLESNSGWLVPVQKKIYFRNGQGTALNVRFDKSQMKEPGLYTGKISAFPEGRKGFPEFSMLATVIIPYEFNGSNRYTQTFEKEVLQPGRHKRYFINIPSGTGNVTIKISSDGKNYAQAVYRLFDPDGENIYTSQLLNSDLKEAEFTSNHENLRPGVYELVVHGYYMAKQASVYNLKIECSGVNSLNKEIVLDTKNRNISVMNSFSQVKQYELTGRLLGYRKEFTAEFNGVDRYVYPFVIRKNESSKEFNFSISKEDFNKFTDFSVIIYDESGKALIKDGLNYENGEISLENTFGEKDSTKLSLELIPAFANKAGYARVEIKEVTSISSPVEFPVQYGQSSRIELYPNVEKKLKCSFEAPSYYYPADSKPYGKVYFRSIETDKVELELPFLFK